MAVILLSGGLDSAFNLAQAVRAGKARQAITFDYGQRAATRELAAAKELANYYRVPWRALNLPWLGEISASALTRPEKNLPQPGLHELDDFNTVIPSMEAVWVPNRNGLFLNAAAAFAEAQGFAEVFVGFNREEAGTFPDNSEAYLQALNAAFEFSTRNKVKVASYALHMDKTEILRAALEIELPLELVWSCYESAEQRCGSCESCKRTIRGLKANGARGAEWCKRLFPGEAL